MKYRSTKDAARELGINPVRLQRLVWECRIATPEKCGGSYLWSEDDINRASKTLLNRPYRPTQSAVLQK